MGKLEFRRQKFITNGFSYNSKVLYHILGLKSTVFYKFKTTGITVIWIIIYGKLPNEEKVQEYFTKSKRCLYVDIEIVDVERDTPYVNINTTFTRMPYFLFDTTMHKSPFYSFWVNTQ